MMTVARVGACVLLVSLVVLPAGRGDEGGPADRALIVVRVPARAALRFGDSATAQTGPERLFISPVLKPGQTYTYKVTAQWEQDGTLKKEIRHVVVSAGKRSVVNFLQPQVRSDSGEPPTTAPPAPSPPRLQPRAEPPRTQQPKPEPPKTEPEPPAESAPAGDAESHTRTFLFRYRTTVKDLPPNGTARVWIPLAQSTPAARFQPANGKPAAAPYADQVVSLASQKLPPDAKTSTSTEKQYGNEILYVEDKPNPAGELPIELVFRVTRREVRTLGPKPVLVKVDPEEDIERYLKPDVKVPVGGKPLELIRGKAMPEDQFAAAKMLYDVVNKHMTYSKKGTGWGQGDAVWACASGYGNCTDFHSLFISLARAEQIPAKFVMGFAIPEKRGGGPIGGYHCWAWFHPEGRGWIPVDISEANQHPDRQEYYFGSLTENRVQFTTGRDLTLVPAQKGPPLNFFIYPYVEVDGQPYPAEKVERQFSYEDIPATP
jgi:uncharacterized protein (TIGR03000 family)